LRPAPDHHRRRHADRRGQDQLHAHRERQPRSRISTNEKIIALDIGGTNTRVALINEKYEIESVKISPTVVGNTDLFLANVKKTILEAIPSKA
jgi:hexokinase